MKPHLDDCDTNIKLKILGEYPREVVTRDFSIRRKMIGYKSINNLIKVIPRTAST